LGAPPRQLPPPPAAALPRRPRRQAASAAGGGGGSGPGRPRLLAAGQALRSRSALACCHGRGKGDGDDAACNGCGRSCSAVLATIGASIGAEQTMLAASGAWQI
jgi:hypothetical protein